MGRSDQAMQDPDGPLKRVRSSMEVAPLVGAIRGCVQTARNSTQGLAKRSLLITKTEECAICGEKHLARDCPKKRQKAVKAIEDRQPVGHRGSPYQNTTAISMASSHLSSSRKEEDAFDTDAMRFRMRMCNVARGEHQRNHAC